MFLLPGGVLDGTQSLTDAPSENKALTFLQIKQTTQHNVLGTISFYTELYMNALNLYRLVYPGHYCQGPSFLQKTM